MAIKMDREYRTMKIVREQMDEKEYKVRGHATTFEKYCLYKDGETEYYEIIDRSAFDEADMSDVIFLYNHEGMVYARNRNNTLILNTDEQGLKVEADLGSTSRSIEIFEAIQSGLIDRMSFAFKVKEDSYNRETRTRTILKIEKVYDVSAVSFPANPGTDIEAVSARGYFNGVIEAEKAERLENERKLQLEKEKYNYLEVTE